MAYLLKERHRGPVPSSKLALHANVFNNGATGKLRDFITKVDATLAGGSTLLAQEKYRNDFQRMNDVIMGYRASGAGTNGYYTIDPDSPSYSAGTVGGWLTLNAAVLAYTALEYWQPPGCMKVTCGANASGGSQHDVTAATLASTQYIKQVMIKAPAGKAMRLSAVDDVGQANTDWTASGGWEFKTVIRTFDAASTVRSWRVGFNASGAAGDIFYQDCNLFQAGATPIAFTEKECTATTCTFPTPFAASGSFSFLIFVWVPWAGNDGAYHYLLDARLWTTVMNGVSIRKTNANNLELIHYDNAGTHKSRYGALNAVNWPAGSFHRIAGSDDEAGIQRLFLDGVDMGHTTGTVGRGTSIRTTAHVGADISNTGHFNGLILPFIYRTAWGDDRLKEITSARWLRKWGLAA